MKITLQQIIEAFQGKQYAKAEEIAGYLNILHGSSVSVGKRLAAQLKYLNLRPRVQRVGREKYRAYKLEELEQVARTGKPFEPLSIVL